MEAEAKATWAAAPGSGAATADGGFPVDPVCSEGCQSSQAWRSRRVRSKMKSAMVLAGGDVGLLPLLWLPMTAVPPALPNAVERAPQRSRESQL